MELVKLLLDKGANTFNPVVLNGVSDYFKLSLDKIVGEKGKARSREKLMWRMEENVPKKEIHDYAVVVIPLGIIRAVVIECLNISGYQSFLSSEANSFASLFSYSI